MGKTGKGGGRFFTALDALAMASAGGCTTKSRLRMKV